MVMYQYFSIWDYGDLTILVEDAKASGEKLLLHFHFLPNDSQYGKITQPCFEAFYEEEHRYALVFSSENAKDLANWEDFIFSDWKSAKNYLGVS